MTAGEGGRGVCKSLKGITWFAAGTEGDQSLSTEYKGGGNHGKFTADSLQMRGGVGLREDRKNIIALKL